MKHSPAHFLSLLASAALFQAHPLAAGEITPVLLRYALANGPTNAYSLQIEAQGDSGREAVAGTFVVSPRAAGSNVMVLSFRGQLHPKSVGGLPPMMGPRPGFSTPLLFFGYGPQNDSRELLIKALNDPDAGIRATMAKGLGRLKDSRAIDPLVSLLATGQTDQPYYRPARESAAAEALVSIGPSAEPAVLALLKEKNIETRCQACNILKQVGTKKSLGPLKDLVLSSSKELSEVAAEACRSIQGRQAD